MYCIDDTFATCHSYKGSYRYMINVLREANPYMRIILLNCTYSEYDKTLPSPYGKTYNSSLTKAFQTTLHPSMAVLLLAYSLYILLPLYIYVAVVPPIA